VKLIHPDGQCTKPEMEQYVIQVQTNPNGRRFNIVGTTGKGIRDSARMAYEYLKGNASKMGIDRDIATYDTNIQSKSCKSNSTATRPRRPTRRSRWGSDHMSFMFLKGVSPFSEYAKPESED